MALIPKYSIRQLLIAMIGVAFLAACLAGAYRGNLIFYGLIVGFVTMIFSLAGLGVVYWSALLIAKIGQLVWGTNSTTEKLVWLAILFGPLFGSNVSVVAQTNLPPGKSGFAVMIDDDYPSNQAGYRTVRIHLETNPKLPVKKDVNLQATFRSSQWGGPHVTHNNMSIPLVLRSGTSSVSAEVYLPAEHLNGNQSQSLLVERDVFDGQFNPRRDVCEYEIGANGFGNSQFAPPSILFISSDVSQNNGTKLTCWNGKILNQSPMSLSILSDAVIPTFDKCLNCLADAIVNGARYGNAPNANVTNRLTAITLCPAIHATHPAELPQDWIGLSCVDQILLSFDELKLMASNHELQRDALNRWVAAGGTLIVFDTGTSFERADQASKLLLGAQRNETLGQSGTPWREPSPNLLRIQKLILPAAPGNYYAYNNDQVNFIQPEEVEVAEVDRWIKHESLTSLETEARFLVGQHLNGRLIAVADTMQNWSEADWQQLLNGIELTGSSLAENIGTTQGKQVLFKIPGVGEPPLIVFQSLIGLFILLGGPGVYFVLSRTGQMQLFFLLVPLLSLTVCLGLVAYATFVDGFESWGRVHSATWIDHRTESAVTHSRCSYFCGTQPGPYRFSQSIAPLVSTNVESQVTSLGQTSAGLTIAGGDIRSRTPHQVVAIRSYQLEQQLRWLPPQVDADGVKATDDLGTFRNQLGSDVRLAVARTEAGWVFVENLATDQFLPAQATDSLSANGLLRALAKDLPISTYTNDQQIYYGYRAVDALGQGSEYKMIEALQNGKGADYLDQPNTYIAILESFPVVHVQIEPVHYKKQLHVIIGKW